MEAAGGDPAQFDGTLEEVRVAMALNGGVSLAVWMGGCAVELDAARRAHLGPEDLRTASTENQEGPGSERTIYHALCKAFHRKLVIDLMSGSSAGGINGALLAAAIEGGRRLHPDYIREKWVSLGDLESLLHPLRTSSPTSLMGGHAFFTKLKQAFDEILPTKEVEADASKLKAAERKQWELAKELLRLPPGHEDPEAAREPVKLDVTTTDVRGRERKFRDTWGEELVATEYRQRFRFRTREDYNAQALAMAARASASFPLAFEPWAVDGQMLDLEGRRWLIDGGLLDNAPIRAVLDLVPARPSERPVRRFLCYINADPPLTRTFDLDADLEDANAPGDQGIRRRRRKSGDAATRPQLQDVVAYMVSLPRKATFVDQLQAIQHAASRSTTVDSGEAALLALDEPCLESTAAALIGAYRSRRRLHSLEEMLEQPADVAVVAGRLENGAELPWIPRDLTIPGYGEDGKSDKTWGWGARAAQRILYFALDFIRPAAAVHCNNAVASERLAGALRNIYDGLARLETIHEQLVADTRINRLMLSLVDVDVREVPSVVCALRCLMEAPERDPRIREIVECALEETFAVRSYLAMPGDDGGPRFATALFGTGADAPDARLDAARRRTFLARTLYIEVLRRAFTAGDVVDSDQPLHFAQITPCSPTLIWTPWPLHVNDAVPATPDDKLTGTRWGHFAAFYRASWRANDFMWGRLDGAVRVVDMLLAPKDERGIDTEQAIHVLAEALAPAEAFEGGAEKGAERRWLIAETLADAAQVPPERKQDEQAWRDAEAVRLEQLDRDGLLTEMRTRMREDFGDAQLDGRPPRSMTRALCVRAAQWEVLRREMPRVIETSKADRGLGTSVAPLEVIPAKGGTWKSAIMALREEKTPLPQRLGVDDTAERASTLMIRTASHGALIGLSALRDSGLPGAPAAVLPRALLLPIAGMVARRWWPYPLAVVAAFWSFALVLAARMITLNPRHPGTWDSERWLSVGITWLAAAGVLSVCLVPFWRAVRSRSWKGWVVQGSWLAALLAAGGGVGIVLLLLDPHVGVVNIVAQTGSEPPWKPAAGLALIVFGVFRFVPRFVPDRARAWMTGVTKSPWKGWMSLVLFLGPWLLLAGWAVAEFVGQAAFGGSSDWTRDDEWTARIALIGPGAVGLGYALLAVRRRKNTARDVIAGLQR